MAQDRDEFDNRLAIRLSLLGALALAPFSVLHLARGDAYMSGVVGGLNLLCLLAAGLLRVPRLTCTVHYGLGVACTLAAYLAVIRTGAAGLFWAYPLVLVNFYVLPLRLGAALNAVFFLALMPLLAMIGEPARPTRVIFTLLLVNVFAYVFCRRVHDKQAELERQALNDPLTGVGNRRQLEDSLRDAVALYRRYRRPVSLIVLDVDHFKRINDSIGHAGGDRALRALAELLGERLRRNDGLYRFGGEEFVILAPQTDLIGADRLAEDLRRAVEAAALVETGAVTVSAGVAQLLPNEEAQAWLRRADEALYVAKGQGRNRVAISQGLRATG